MSQDAEIREAFALFDKRGTGSIPSESLGDLLRALGQNPTQAEVAELASQNPRDIDYDTFTGILHRPDGYKSGGSEEEFIRGFAVFDKDQTGHIGVGELRYVLTNLGEKLTDQEVDEILAGVRVGQDGTIDYRAFVREIMAG
ncbi:EF-hand [Cystobasidium minutum MCA 4210]|uniref:EF-hand n=1 Tax=Cystobasidium minutum MCA 4210 TaxID=1397322 RepID=UPI0034CF76A1|eukprot:jgi/Rhomi1/9859/CE9858_480